MAADAMHDAEANTQKADSTKWDNNWDEIEKQRAEIKAIKDKQRIQKLEAEEYGTPVVDEEVQHKIEDSHNQWKDTHDSEVVASKADASKWDNDWEKINKQRESIKAIKDKQRIMKLEAAEYGPIVDEEVQAELRADVQKERAVLGADSDYSVPLPATRVAGGLRAGRVLCVEHGLELSRGALQRR